EGRKQTAEQAAETPAPEARTARANTFGGEPLGKFHPVLLLKIDEAMARMLSEGSRRRSVAPSCGGYITAWAFGTTMAKLSARAAITSRCSCSALSMLPSLSGMMLFAQAASTYVHR